MRKLAFFLLLAGLAQSAFAVKRVSVEQLEKVLTAAEHRPDGKAAKQLSGLQLTERFSSARLARWEPVLPGPESRRALVLLTDLSAFLDPPAAEIPAKAAPDIAGQRQIMALAVDYVARTVRQLPNLFATRDTIHFEDTPARKVIDRVDWRFTPYQPMLPVSRSSATVMYLNGREVLKPEAESSVESAPVAPGLTTRGEFGPILTTVLVDAAHGTLAWSHWERGPTGPAAVFRFSVPRSQSHYQLEFCCIVGLGNSGVFRRFPAYHGEIAVDPADGTILRLTLIANLNEGDPLVKSDMLVTYGPVSIDGKTYICPIKSISISLAPVQAVEELSMQNLHGELVQPAEREMPRPLQTMLNEVEFDQYHLFHANVRILAAGETRTGGNGAVVPAVGAANIDTKIVPEKPEKAANSPAAETGAESRHAVAPEAPVVPVNTGPIPVPSAPAIPEFNVAAATGLPELSDQPPGDGEKSFTLHVTTRLVDVNVVALDKKGHPVKDLKAENFEIYDNGRRQAVRFFSQATGIAAEQSNPEKPDHAGDQLVFSNRREFMAGTTPGAAATQAGVTILLIDADSLKWGDWNYARSGLLKFLRTLPPGERLGVYVRNGPGFQILERATTDRAQLVSTVSQWMPSAQALARSRESEQRNRQQFDYVANQSDLAYVNGNMNTAPDSATPPDPKLRSQGSDPEADALSVLIGVSRRLGTLPGHKNVVWVASDNVLVNWSDQAVSHEKGGQHLDGLVLRAQEALNDAHASLYPLDGSQLETMAVDPSLANLNVELSPSAMAPPPPHGGGPGSGRAAAELEQDTRAIEPAIQEMAAATGGRCFQRSGEIAKELKTVVGDGQATYLLGFIPDTPADGKYHRLTIRLISGHGVKLRYRTGYLYSVEPTALKDRFRQAIWQPFDMNAIALSARPVPASAGTTLKLNIPTDDVALKLLDERWTDKLDIFLVERDEEGLQARITGQTLRLRLKPATYQSLLRPGIPFDQFIEKIPLNGSVRIVVVDENSGRMGSITIPAAMLHQKS